MKHTSEFQLIYRFICCNILLRCDLSF